MGDPGLRADTAVPHHPCMAFILVEGGPGAERLLAAAAAALEADGWHVVDDFDSRPAALRAVLRGTLVTPRDAAAALLAALDGFGLLVLAAATPEVVDRLVDDLGRLGPVQLRSGRDVPDTTDVAGGEGDAHARDASLTAPDAEGRAILALLAEGHSLGEAAARLRLSRRTADRRLAEVRARLGVTRTTEAIARAARLGWLGGPPERPARPRPGESRPGG